MKAIFVCLLSIDCFNDYNNYFEQLKYLAKRSSLVKMTNLIKLNTK